MVPLIELPVRVLGDGPRSAFGLAREARSIRFLVDIESLEESVEKEILLGFAHHASVKMLSLRSSQVKLDDEGGATIDDEAETNHRRFFLRGVADRVDTAKKVFPDLVTGPGFAERIAFVCCATVNGYDALVTQSSELLKLANHPLVSAANVMTPGNALALLGLFLRHRSDFVYACSKGGTRRLTRVGYYNLFSTLLTPKIIRWVARCPTTVDGQERRPRVLVQAVTTRISRALRARDGLLTHVLMDSGYEPPDDALLHLDTLLVALRGAFDATAGVTEAVYGPTPNVPHPGWANRGWCNAVKAKALKLAPFLKAGGIVRDTFDIVNFLRDFVHGEPFEPVFMVDGSATKNGSLLVPEHKKQRAFLDAIERQGGYDAWGILPIGDEQYMLVLHTFVERVLPWSVAAINAVCESVEVERFGFGSDKDERAYAVDLMQSPADAIVPVLALGAVNPTALAH